MFRHKVNDRHVDSGSNQAEVPIIKRLGQKQGPFSQQRLKPVFLGPKRVV